MISIRYYVLVSIFLLPSSTMSLTEVNGHFPNFFSFYTPQKESSSYLLVWWNTFSLFDFFPCNSGLKAERRCCCSRWFLLLFDIFPLASLFHNLYCLLRIYGMLDLSNTCIQWSLVKLPRYNLRRMKYSIFKVSAVFHAR